MTNMWTTSVLVTATLCALGGSARADDPDKSGYFLWKPTPRHAMRAMSTDRPDTTESPYTLDAGHFQAESELASVTGEAGGRSLALMGANLKIGLTNWSDLQVVLSPYERISDDGSDAQQGFGDTNVRIKVNLWGNDGGATAGALMPFVKIPTASEGLGNDKVEGGLIGIVGVAAPADIAAAFMAEVDMVADEMDEYGTELLVTGTAGRALVGPLGGFLELTGARSLSSDGDIAAGINSGFTYGLSDDMALDAGVNVGLTDAADDFRAFVGGSFRL
jgi:Putative MetA-pathway of phenol degradation